MIEIKIEGKIFKLVTAEDLKDLKHAVKKLTEILKEEKSYPEDLFDRFLKEVEKW